MEALVEQSSPFKFFGNIKQIPFSFFNFTNNMRPRYEQRFAPKIHKVVGALLYNFDSNMYTKIQRHMTRYLESGYGTIVFDGCGDITGDPVVNVLMCIEGNATTGRIIFFEVTLHRISISNTSTL